MFANNGGAKILHK